jgi:hypothetical protein
MAPRTSIACQPSGTLPIRNRFLVASGERGMRALLIILLLAMLAAVGYFAYSAMAVEGEPIPTEGYVALALGAGFSVIVGVGLMVLLFFSSRRGYDEPPHFR